jgi:F-type H+-transporting ATPase subunit epsilon
VADTLDLQIVTPGGIALHRQVTELTAPSVSGEFGVLPGHVPLLAALKPGIVTYRTSGQGSPSSGGEGEAKVAVANGFAQIVGDKALLLTERFVKKEDVDIVAVRARLKEVGDELGAWSGEHDAIERKNLIEEEQWLAAELELIGDPPPPTVREDTRFVQKDVVVAEEEPPPEEPAKG